jgi:hypothetical protein
VGGKGGGWGQGGEMNQALYAHMNNKRKKKNLSGSLTLKNIFMLYPQITSKSFKILDLITWNYRNHSQNDWCQISITLLERWF